MEKGVPIRAVSRSISVLQAVNRHGSLSMMAISRQSAIPYPTACRIVQTLMYEGLLEQEPARKRYRATALVHSLAHGYQPASQLVDIGGGLIRDLTRAVGWPVSLTVRVGARMVVRDSTHHETSLTFERYYPGFTLPLLECAAGHVCLAFMEEAEREDLLQWIGSEDSDNVPRGPQHVRDVVAMTRDKGYAAFGWGRHNLTPGKTSSLAVPILRDGHFEGALTLIYFASSMKQPAAIERYLHQIMETAAQIGASLERAAGEPALDSARKIPAMALAGGF